LWAFIVIFVIYFFYKNCTKAELKAPSAKTRRKKFGTRNAPKKASDKTLTPIYLAIKISRIKPKILDREIKKEIVKKDLNIFYEKIFQKSSEIFCGIIITLALILSPILPTIFGKTVLSD